MDFALAGGGAGGQGASVKGVAHGDDFVASRLMAPEAGQLDHRFIGFGSRVAEEALTAQREVGEPLRQQCLIDVVEEVGAVVERGHLIADRLDHLGVGMADTLHGNTGGKVDIGHAIGIPDTATRATHQRNRRRIGWHHILVKQSGNIVILAHRQQSPFLHPF